MKSLRFFGLAVLGLFAFAATAQEAEAPADAASDGVQIRADVWAVVEAQWDADEKGDKKWIERLIADDFAGWGNNSPAPRSKTSIKMWDRFADEQSKMLVHELYPLSIIVHGDVAVAHYLYSSASEDKDGEVETENGRFTDVLVLTDDGWKFLAWHGGADD